MSDEWTDPADLQPLTDAASRDAEDLAAASGCAHWWTPAGISVESTPGQEPPDGSGSDHPSRPAQWSLHRVV